VNIFGSAAKRTGHKRFRTFPQVHKSYVDAENLSNGSFAAINTGQGGQRF